MRPILIRIPGVVWRRPRTHAGRWTTWGYLLAVIATCLTAPPASAVDLNAPIAFYRDVPNTITIELALKADATYQYRVVYSPTLAPEHQGWDESGHWDFDATKSIVTLHPDDPEAVVSRVTVHEGSPLTITIDSPGRSAPLFVGAAEVSVSTDPSGPPQDRLHDQPFSLKTADGHYVTIVDGGGHGGPTDGPGTVALHTDTTQIGPWETFELEWVDSTHCALRTANGNYLTAVNGGGVGGPNDSSSPVHTDAGRRSTWETLTLDFDPKTRNASIRGFNGQYLSAVNGGGIHETGRAAFYTDATRRGTTETFECILEPADLKKHPRD